MNNWIKKYEAALSGVYGAICRKLPGMGNFFYISFDVFVNSIFFDNIYKNLVVNSVCIIYNNQNSGTDGDKAVQTGTAKIPYPCRNV